MEQQSSTVTTTQTMTINESSFTVVTKQKPILILDDDDDDDDECDGTFDVKDIIHITTNTRSSSSSSPFSCHVGSESFEDCSRLQRELMDLQESLFRAMAKRAVEAQLNYSKLQNEMVQLQMELKSMRTLLQKEKERSQTLAAYIHSQQGNSDSNGRSGWPRIFGME